MHSKKIKFSVLMSVYKNEKPEYLEAALLSVLNQTILPEEIILVQDGPVPPEITSVIKKIMNQTNLLYVIESKENIGLGNALALGLKHCKYELVARMDTDDICIKDRFEKQIRYFIDDPSLSIIGGNIREFDTTIDNIVGYRNVPSDDCAIKKYLQTRCPFNHMTVMFKKKDVIEVGGYLDLHYNEDYYLWIRMAMKQQRFKNINEVLVNVRVSCDMYKRRGGIKYFKSELKIQQLLLSNKIITINKFLLNVIIRFIIQILMPNKIRMLVFKKLCRKSIELGKV